MCGGVWRNSVYRMPSWASGMINYWAFTNSYLDSVTLVTATATSTGLGMVSDRMGVANSALNFSGG